MPNKIENMIASFVKYRTHFLCVPLFTLAFMACYLDVLKWMVERYLSPDSYYSHGFLIPFLSGWLIWREKEQLEHADATLFLPGLALIILALLLHFLATVLYIFSLAGFSIIFFLTGISLFLCGKRVTRLIIFPLAYLVFMFPLPLVVINMLSFPMKKAVAATSVYVVGFSGVPIFREGFQITIPGGNLLVDNPCSGLRSMITFLALGALLSYLGRLSFTGRVVLFFSAVPVAMLSNILRVSLLILISHYWGIEAASPDTMVHGASGVAAFIPDSGNTVYYTQKLQLCCG